MSAAVVRRVVLAICGVGIAGMIVTNIAGSTGWAMTFGLVTAVAVLCSIVATAVSAGGPGQVDDDVDAVGARVEQGVAELVVNGADEAVVRAVVADAVRLGRVTR